MGQKNHEHRTFTTDVSRLTDGSNQKELRR